MNASDFRCQVPPHEALALALVRGYEPSVYVLALNHRSWLDRLGAALSAPPYKAPPQAPVLMIKPPASLRGQDAEVILPASQGCLALGVSVSLVIARETYCITAEQAAHHVGALALCADLSLALDDSEAWYRPGLPRRAADGFAIQGDRRADATLPPEVCTYINGELKHRLVLAELIRGPAQAVAQVSELMSLHSGDQLWLGSAADSPMIYAGDHVRVEAQGLPSLEFSVQSIRDEEDA
jgi:5-oxopent-3-ene-1,2,5-tricarboxylate decarboxylase / 2-hydroxyhepta-2,4-diene-1,7-dioate isomerase